MERRTPRKAMSLSLVQPLVEKCGLRLHKYYSELSTFNLTLKYCRFSFESPRFAYWLDFSKMVISPRFSISLKNHSHLAKSSGVAVNRKSLISPISITSPGVPSSVSWFTVFFPSLSRLSSLTIFTYC